MIVSSTVTIPPPCLWHCVS